MFFKPSKIFNSYFQPFFSYIFYYNNNNNNPVTLYSIPKIKKATVKKKFAIKLQDSCGYAVSAMTTKSQKN